MEIDDRSTEELLRSDLWEARADNYKLLAEVGVLKKKLATVEAECLRLQADLGHGRDERAKLREKLAAAEAEITAVANQRNAAIDAERRVSQQLAAAESNYAKLHGVVKAYMEADPQIRGEAYRDVVGTMEHLAGADDALGWPACYARLKANVRDLQAQLSTAEAALARISHFATGGCKMGDANRLKCIAMECKATVAKKEVD